MDHNQADFNMLQIGHVVDFAVTFLQRFYTEQADSLSAAARDLLLKKLYTLMTLQESETELMDMTLQELMELTHQNND